MLGFDVCTARKVWTASLIALLFLVIYVASSTLLVVVFAVFFSYLVYPMVDLVERVRPPTASCTLPAASLKVPSS